MSASLAAQAIREMFHYHHMWPSFGFEELLTRNYSRLLKPGDVVIDIGAHTGLHTQEYAKLVGETGKVFAFEPLPEIYAELREKLAPYAWVSLTNGVLSDRDGEVSFVRAIGLPGESGLLKRGRYDIPDTQTVTITVSSETLDGLAADFDRLDYIKIDTEGAELTILGAGVKTLMRLRPRVSVEWGVDTYGPYGHAAGSLFDFARQHSLTIVDLFGNAITSRTTWLEVSDRGTWDFFLVPDERLAEHLYAVSPHA